MNRAFMYGYITFAIGVLSLIVLVVYSTLEDLSETCQVCGLFL
jgi:hypothetical protein